MQGSPGSCMGPGMFCWLCLEGKRCAMLEQQILGFTLSVKGFGFFFFL